MEKSKFLYGALGLLALGFVGCTNDVQLDEPQVVQKDEVRYLRVAIANPPASRADAEFAQGTASENEVHNMYFKFFDRNGRFVANSSLTDASLDGSFTPAGAGQEGNVGRIKEAVVRIDLESGEGYPAYVLCFINPFQWGDIQSENLSLDDFRNRSRETYRQDSRYFSMNNSVYFGNDPVSGATDVKIAATPIQYDQLFTTYDEAEAATNATVDIYVERYAAKVQFSLKEDGIEDVVVGGTENEGAVVGGTTLKFKPLAWTINADAPNMYVIKRFENSNATTDVIPTLTDVNTLLAGWTTWNDPANFRSYWACSPGFYATNFPEVSDQIADYYHENEDLVTNGLANGQGLVEWNAMEEGQTDNRTINYNAPNVLRYYSYNQIVNNTSANPTVGSGAGIKTWVAAADGTLPCKYVLENTMGAQAFASKNPKAAAPSVLLVGEYTIGDATTASTFYIYNENVVTSDAAIKNALISANNALYVQPEGATEPVLLTNANITTAISAVLNVRHPAQAVRGSQPVPHRYVTLQIGDLGGVNNLYYSPYGTDQFIQVTAANLAQVNTILWNSVGNVEKFTDGKCYYSIPIQHLGMTENTSESPMNAEGKIDWTKVRVGDFGLVRNHVYTINVDGITGRATGINNLDYPLVPPAELNAYYVKYRLNILNWRIVPNQSVTL